MPCLEQTNSGLINLTTGELGDAYDKHQDLLRMYKIPTISLEDTDSAKWQALCDALATPGTQQSKTWAASCRQMANRGDPWPDEP